MKKMHDISQVNKSERVYYVTEARKATLRELWRMSPSTIKGKLSAILYKLLGLASSPQIGMAQNDAVRCSANDLPELQEKCENTIRSLGQLGFSPTIWMRLPILGEGSACSLALLSKDPTVYAIIVYVNALANGQEHSQSTLSFVSLHTTTIWVTSSGVQELNSPQNFNVQYFPNSSPEFLCTTHSERMQAVPTETLQTFDAENLWSTIRKTERLITQFNIQRGVFRPIMSAEVDSITKV
jgi:hypothetical protein